MSKEQQNKSYRHPAFKGLSDGDLVSVYNMTSIKKSDSGKVLVKEGDTDQTMYLILGGSARLIKNTNGHARQIATLRQGDSVPVASSFKNGTRAVSVVVSEPLTAFVLDERNLNALPPQVQLTIYKNLNSSASRQVHNLTLRQINLSNRNKRLTSNVARFFQARNDQYVDSEMIHGILKGIPRLPMYANRLAVVILDENVSARDVAELAKLDPSLVSVVLKTVNSAFYGFKNKISDFQHAVLLLGLNQVYQLVMDVGIRSTMPKTAEFKELIFHSMVVSFMGFEISQLSNMKRAAALSTIGLLHDIGKSVIMLLKRQHPQWVLLLGMLDHAKLGSLLLGEWNIPDIVCRSLEYQCYPEWLPPGEIPEEHRESVAALFIAHLCYEYFRGEKEINLPTIFLGEYMDVLNRPERSIAELVEKRLLPSLNKKMKTFPEDMRGFLTTGANNILKKRGNTSVTQSVTVHG